MKKYFISLVLCAMALCTLHAQETNSAQLDNKTARTGCTDFMFSWESDYKILGIDFGQGFGKLGYVAVKAEYGFDEYSADFVGIGLGLQQRYITDKFLLQGKIYPYAGCIFMEDEYDFTYGAGAEVEAGIKIYTQKSGARNYLVFGYGWTATEFKTEFISDSGQWHIGITTVF